jgi:hypothetical protein
MEQQYDHRHYYRMACFEVHSSNVDVKILRICTTMCLMSTILDLIQMRLFKPPMQDSVPFKMENLNLPRRKALNLVCLQQANN